MRWLSVDPGLDCTGWAFWDDTKLLRCGISRRGSKAQGPNIWREHAVNLSLLPEVDCVVTEFPRVYPRSPINPAGLMQLAAVAGAIIGRLDPVLGFAYLPADWKGKRKKEDTTPQILKALDEIERNVVALAEGPASLLHNMMDAIGIGLWHQGRIKWEDLPVIARPKRKPRRKKGSKRIGTTRKGSSKRSRKTP